MPQSQASGDGATGPGGITMIPQECSARCKDFQHINNRHSGGGRTEMESQRGWIIGRVTSAGLLCVLLCGTTIILSSQRDGIRPRQHAGADGEGVWEAASGDSVIGMAASSSMWDVDNADFNDEPLLDASLVGSGGPQQNLESRRQLLFHPEQGLQRLVGGGRRPAAVNRNAAGRAGATPPKRGGEPAMLNNFNKVAVDYLDLDDVQEGRLWIPVAVENFTPTTQDPLVKMCQVDYATYSEAPWVLPMGGLLSIHSGCADLSLDTVQVIRISILERILANSAVPVNEPTGFIFHETRCGSTLVANMLANVKTNVMWSESTGPWKVMHTCPKCEKSQIVRFLKVIMDTMSRSPNHSRFYFKFQSSEDIDAVTSAFPDVPWVFIFREPVEVMMSRLGAQRIGMEGMEKEVTARVVKGMTEHAGSRPRLKGKSPREVQTAMQLAGLCKKAISAFEAHPGMGMMVEYPHLPEGIVTTVLPNHFHVHVSEEEHEVMMDSTRRYSKVATFAKGDTPDSKFIEDTTTKHNTASVAVTDAAQRFLYADYYKMKKMQSWSSE